MASFAATATATALPPGCICGAPGTRPRGGRCVASAAALPAAAARTQTHYEVLGVGAGASTGEIRAAYRRLAREVHPDAAAAGSGDEGFIRLHAAYAALADPDERARYDRAVAFRRAAAPVVASGSRPPRRWETDQCW